MWHGVVVAHLTATLEDQGLIPHPNLDWMHIFSSSIVFTFVGLHLYL